jgi:hypothetical protein
MAQITSLNMAKDFHYNDKNRALNDKWLGLSLQVGS